MKGKYKKSNIYFDDTPTLQSLNAVTSDGIAKAINEGAGGDYTQLRHDVDNIQAVIPSNATTSNKLATLADVSGGGGVTIKSETHIVPFSQSGLGYVSFDYTTKCLLSVYSNTSNKIVGVHSMGANYASSQYNIPIGSFIRLQGADTSDGSMGTITGNVSITILYLDK